ncbi:MAG: hypothetical protein HC897_11970 [Thermoanaerobaculia bacterium]|nr:hypothetical protein [Thermoanaerobaculia bacterium]
MQTTTSMARTTWLAVLGMAFSLGAAHPAGAEFLLSDPGSEVYHRYVVVAGSTISVEMESDLVGNLHCNGTIAIKRDAHVAGDVSAVGTIVDLGTVTGTLTPGAPPVPLPALLDETAMRSLADRVFEHDVVLTDAVIDDVVFVDGTVQIQGRLDGVGTIFATGDVLLRVSAALPAAGSQISIVALGDVKLAANRRFRGALHAGHDVVFEPGVGFEGVIVASHKVLIKRASRPTFSSFDTMPPLITVSYPADGATVTEEVLRVVGTALDASGVVSVTVDGVPAQLAGETFSASVSLAPGANTLTVIATDRPGNTGSLSLTVTLETDTTPPQAAITLPPEGTFVLEARPAVWLTLDDETALDAGSLVLSANGAPLAASCSEDSSGSVVCLPEQDLPEGPVQLGATVADAAGNLGSAVVDFVVDTEGMGVTITAPLPDTVTNADRVTVAGTAAASVTSVSVNGVERRWWAAGSRPRCRCAMGSTRWSCSRPKPTAVPGRPRCNTPATSLRPRCASTRRGRVWSRSPGRSPSPAWSTTWCRAVPRRA